MSDVALTAADMDEISDELAVIRPDSCLITARTEGAPGADPSFSAGVNVACRVTPALRAAQVTSFGGRISPETDFIVSIGRGIVVNRGSRVTVNGQTYVVLNDPDAASFHFELNLECKDSDG